MNYYFKNVGITYISFERQKFKQQSIIKIYYKADFLICFVYIIILLIFFFYYINK